MAEEKKTKEEKKAEKAAKKAARKEKAKAPKDHWFSWRGIRKEAKRVQWPSWKSSDKGAGIWQNTGEVVIFTAFFALFFVLVNWGVAELLGLIGIGA